MRYIHDDYERLAAVEVLDTRTYGRMRVAWVKSLRRWPSDGELDVMRAGF